MTDEGEVTRYVASAMHPDEATPDRHAGPGFFQGRSTRIDPLGAFARQPG
jgi:hypothetical protein